MLSLMFPLLLILVVVVVVELRIVILYHRKHSGQHNQWNIRASHDEKVGCIHTCSKFTV